MSILPHIAFELLPVIPNAPFKITDVALFGDRIFLASGTGLFVYRIDTNNNNNNNNNNGAIDSRLIFNDKKFARKPITKLEVIESHAMLVTLSDSINIHNIRHASEVTPIMNIAKTKGSSLFALDLTSNKGEPLLCVAAKKKLTLYALRGVGAQLDAIELHELALPDTARMLHVCGDRVCVGFKKEYAMVRMRDGVLATVCQTGRSAAPVAARLPEQQVLLLRDNIGVFAYYDAKATGRPGVTFSEAPLAVAYRFPFVLAALPRCLELRGVGGAAGLAQQLPARGVIALVPSAVSGSGDEQTPLYAASSDALWQLRPVPLSDQCDRLVRERRFDEALALCDAMPVDTKDRAERLRVIKRLHSHHLFANGQYAEALTAMAELRVDPLDVLALYDGLLPSRAAASAATRRLKEHEASVTRLNAAVAAQQAPTTPKIPSQQRRAAYKALIDYITRVRGNAVVLTSTHAAGEEAAASALAASDDYDNTTDITRIIDTSLLKAYLEADPDQLLPFLKSVNQCDVPTSERLLLAAERHAELVELYYARGTHRKALELLSKLAHGRGPMSGFASLIQYLTQLSGKNAPLVFEFSRHALQSEPHAALAIFCRDRPASERLPRSEVVAHLRQHAKDLVQPYLEFILQQSQWVETRAEFHDALVLEYLNTVLALKRNQRRPDKTERIAAGTEPGLLGETRKKLLAFLESSNYYHAERLLTDSEKMPLDDLYEERAIMLAKLGQHEAALSIYVHTLRDTSTALQYCERHWAARNSSSTSEGEVYLALLRVCLRPPPNGEQHTALALQLCNQYADRIDPAGAVALLPDSTRVVELEKFFEHALRQREAERKAGSVVTRLLDAAHTHARTQLLATRARRVVVTRNDVCAVCGKRLGAAAFGLRQHRFVSATPDTAPPDDLVHYMCIQQSQK